MSGSNNYIQLLRVIAVTDFKLRYHGSYLGYIWTLLKPLALFGVMYIVFSVFMNINVPNYQLYLLLGIILWNFFAEGTTLGVQALATKASILKKIYFPRIIIVIASSISTFLGLFVNLLIFALFAIFAGLSIGLYALFFPFLILILYILVVGVSLFLAACYIHFKDINQVWEVFLQVGFWLTPIIYPLTLIPERFQLFVALNPLALIIQAARLVLLENQMPSLQSMIYILFTTFISLLIGLVFFRKWEYLAPQEL